MLQVGKKNRAAPSKPPHPQIIYAQVYKTAETPKGGRFNRYSRGTLQSSIAKYT